MRALFKTVLSLALFFFFYKGVNCQQVGWDNIFTQQNGIDGANGTIEDMFVSKTDIYLTGTFEKAGNKNSPGVALWSNESWHTYPNPATVGWNTGKRIIKTDALYVSIPGGGLRKHTSSGWSWLGDTTEKNNYLLPSLSNSEVYLYSIAANFFVDKPDQIGNLADAVSIGKISGSSIVQVVDVQNNTGLTSGEGITSFLADKGKFYIGGKFSSPYGVAARNVFMYDSNGYVAMGSGLEWSGNASNAIVWNLRIIDGELYAVGNFNQSGSTTLTSFGIAKWNGSNWVSVGNTSGQTTVRDICKGPDGNLYIAQTSGVAYLKSNGYWSQLGSVDRSGGPVIHRIASAGSFIYIVGQFDEVIPKGGGSIESYNIARYRVIAGGGVPAAPSNLTAQSTQKKGDKKIALNWVDNSSDENGFIIQRSLDSTGNWSNIDSVASNIHTFTDVELPANTTYYYRIIAYNLAGLSSASNIANATTDNALGIDDFQNTSEINIYPNPAKNLLYIIVKGDKVERFVIRDLNGKIVSEGNASNHQSIDISNFENGLYVINIYSRYNMQAYKFAKQ